MKREKTPLPLLAHRSKSLWRGEGGGLVDKGEGKLIWKGGERRNLIGALSEEADSTKDGILWNWKRGMRVYNFYYFSFQIVFSCTLCVLSSLFERKRTLWKITTGIINIADFLYINYNFSRKANFSDIIWRRPRQPTFLISWSKNQQAT